MDPELEKGLTFYYSNEAEFAKKEYSVERQVAIAYEAGLQAGRHETCNRIKRVFKTELQGSGVWV